MRSLPILVVWILVGCGENTDVGHEPTGTVALAAAGTGALAVVDVRTGDTRTLVDSGGPFGSIAVAVDGSAVAYSRSDIGVLDREVLITDLAAADTRSIFPSTGQFMPSFNWLRSGWMWYPFASGFAFQTALVGPGRTDARLIGGRSFARVDESPDGELIAYADCVEQVQGRCLDDLVVEAPDGGNRTVLSSGLSISPPRFTPDGNAVAYAATAGAELRLMLQPIGGGAAIDLGPVMGTTLYEYDSIPGGSVFAPDGSEILAYRGGGLVAIALDGSGARSITPQYAHSAAFTATGDVVYELAINTEDPPDDTPMFEYSSFVVTGDGASSALRQNDLSCGLTRISPSGALVSYGCPGLPIHRIDGSLVREAEGSLLLGFDATETGVVIADQIAGVIRYVPVNGGSERVLGSFLTEPNAVEWPPFDYAP